MKKKQLIVASNNHDLYTTKKLLTSGKELNYSPIWINPYQLTLPLAAGPGIALYFHRTTGTNYDDFDLLVTSAQQAAGKVVTNPLLPLKNFRSKDLQQLFFQANALPSVDFVSYRGPTNDEIKQRLHDFKSKRFILKMVRGNQGIGVNLFESFSSLLSMLETFEAIGDQRFIIQPLIEHRNEWRLFFCGDKILACIEKRKSKDDFRGNAKRSKSKIIKKIPNILSELGVSAMKLSGLHYAGIDIIQDTRGRLLILEINPVPGFEQAEELSGINIARELILHASAL